MLKGMVPNIMSVLDVHGVEKLKTNLKPNSNPTTKYGKEFRQVEKLFQSKSYFSQLISAMKALIILCEYFYMI